MIFQSTRPIRGATRALGRPLFILILFQSTRPIRGATKALVGHQVAADISIHAPHTGRDPHQLRQLRHDLVISIHAPHTGRDRKVRAIANPVRDISIHAPHTGRDLLKDVPAPDKDISIHAPHTGRDFYDTSGTLLAY